MRAAGRLVCSPLLKSIDQGAATTVFCCTAPSEQIRPGEFYADCNIHGSAPESKKRSLGEKLWQLSEKHCKPFL